MMPGKPSPQRRHLKPKAVLRLPNLDQAKSAVLNSLSSLDAQRGYRHAIYRRESSEKRYHVTPSATNLLEWADKPVNFVILDFQNFRARMFFPMTRICHLPGQRSHTIVAKSVPIPRCRYRRNTKNSAISQDSPSPDGSELRVTSTKPTNLPSSLARNGNRALSDR
jgi:hypothetical protein